MNERGHQGPQKHVRNTNFRQDCGVDCVHGAANVAMRDHKGPKKIALSGDPFVQLLNELSLISADLCSRLLPFPAYPTIFSAVTSL